MVKIDGENLSLEDCYRVMCSDTLVALDLQAEKKVRANREYLEQKLGEREKIYGINTGFGHLSTVSISPPQIEKLQRNLILSHACGYGENFAEEIVRGIILLRANALAKGCSGVRPEIIHLLLEFLNQKIYPQIPSQGSVGASGDLVPLAHMSLALIGEGNIYEGGKLYPARKILASRGIKPVKLSAKEGLALINGTQAMAAIGVMAVIEGEKMLQQADSIAALTVEALKGLNGPFHDILHQVRPHQGQSKVAHNIRKLLRGSEKDNCFNQEKVQDGYSLRCIPQVHGASRDSLEHCRKVLTVEINSATDNPLIFHEQDLILSGGNFHGQPLALVFDYLALAFAEMGNISERRIERMVNPYLSGLDPFLIKNSGINSGYMVAQYTAAALVSENKVLAGPASIDSIPTSANQEDHVSMGTIAARKLLQILNNLRAVLSIEAICSAQGVDLAEITSLGQGTDIIYKLLRKHVKYLDEDRILKGEIDLIAKFLKEGFLLKALAAAGITLD